MNTPPSTQFRTGAGFVASTLAGFRRVLARVALPILLMLALPAAFAEDVASAAQPQPAPARSDNSGGSDDPLLRLGAGDVVQIQVHSRPELDTTTYVADDGTVDVPMAGPVKVFDTSPSTAARRIEKALQRAEIVLQPQVTVFVKQFRSQQISVLGEVKTPGRITVDSRLTVFDAVAQAGGMTDAASDVVYLLRPDRQGGTQRIRVDMSAMNDSKKSLQPIALRGGDSVFVPRAPQFYIYGEVQAPNMYRLEPGMTVMQAISRGGGITQRGSNSRVEIKRRKENGDYETLSPGLTDVVQAGDVIRVKERIF